MKTLLFAITLSLSTLAAFADYTADFCAATNLLDARKYAQAAEAFEKALPGTTNMEARLTVLAGLMSAANLSGNLEKAVETADQVLAEPKLKGSYPADMCGLTAVRLLTKEQKFSETWKILDQVGENDTRKWSRQDTYCYFLEARGDLEIAQGHFDKAKDYYVQAAAAKGMAGYASRVQAKIDALAECAKAGEGKTLTPDETACAYLAIAEKHSTYNREGALAAYYAASAVKGVSGETKTHGELAYINIRIGEQDWGNARRLALAALQTSGATPVQKASLKKKIVSVAINGRNYPEARSYLMEILTDGTPLQTLSKDEIPYTVIGEFVQTNVSQQAERVAAMAKIGKLYLVEQNFEKAREVFTNALAMPGISDQRKAECQLYIGITYFDTKDYAKAKPEFEKVLSMKGNASPSPWDHDLLRIDYVPEREAKLRLAFIEKNPKVKKVLFLGSSNTGRGDLPGTVMRMSESAPADRVRIVSGDYEMMGTRIPTFWNLGTAPSTPRGVIKAHPWDAVVFEIPYTTCDQSTGVAEYAPRMISLIQGIKALPVIYEVHPFYGWTQKKQFGKYDNAQLAPIPANSAALAPGAYAELQIVGTNPSDQALSEFHSDKLHASEKGAYLMACCLYAALTDSSPEGLFAPTDLKKDAVELLQQAAWKSYCEKRDQFKADRTPMQ
ncbi:MAG: hypothetical protein WCS52_04315 [bacterium]